MYVYGDTIIHNDTFAVIEETFPSFGFHAKILRDSSDYIVDQHGIIYFSSTNFTDTLYFIDYGIHKTSHKMDDLDSLIEIPIGTFQTSNYKGYMHSPDCPDSLRYTHNFYTKNIGRIKSSAFYNSTFCLPEQSWIEERLLRYHIEQ